MKNEATGFKRLIAATGFSMAGLKASYKTEAAFRQEVWLAIVLIPLALFLGDNAIEVSLMIGSVLLLMITELLNTAVELVVDRIGAEFHELSGRAKGKERTKKQKSSNLVPSKHFNFTGNNMSFDSFVIWMLCQKLHVSASIKKWPGLGPSS